MNNLRKKPKTPALHHLIKEMSSDSYHSANGAWSSSQLKDIIDDEEVFILKYIKKEVERIEKEVFDTGTYFHTGTLEPHKLAKEVVVFDGKTRYGKNWDAFKLKHAGKLVVTEKQRLQGDGMVKAVKKSPVSMDYIKGIPEISLFIKLVISNGHIYAPEFGKKLTAHGWVSSKSPPKGGFEVIIKVRADCLGDCFISDLKSTSGRANNKASVRQSISKYKYDLSAALYLDMFALMKPEVTHFVWIFASKENPVAASWVATKNQIMVGRAKWMWAIKRLADLSAANWEIADYLREVDPLPHEMEWILERESDLL